MARNKQRVEKGEGCLTKGKEPCSISREHSDAAEHECALRSLLLSSTVQHSHSWHRTSRGWD